MVVVVFIYSTCSNIPNTRIHTMFNNKVLCLRDQKLSVTSFPFIVCDNATNKVLPPATGSSPDNTTVTSMIKDVNESTYRHLVKELVQWCSKKHLELNLL